MITISYSSRTFSKRLFILFELSISAGFGGIGPLVIIYRFEISLLSVVLIFTSSFESVKRLVKPSLFFTPNNDEPLAFLSQHL